MRVRSSSAELQQADTSNENTYTEEHHTPAEEKCNVRKSPPIKIESATSTNQCRYVNFELVRGAVLLDAARLGFGNNAQQAYCQSLYDIHGRKAASALREYFHAVLSLSCKHFDGHAMVFILGLSRTRAGSMGTDHMKSPFDSPVAVAELLRLLRKFR